MTSQNLNLLPTGFLTRSLLRLRLKQWGLVLLLFWGGMIAYYLVLREEVQNEVEQVEQLRAEVRPIRLQQAETNFANSEVNRLRKRQQLGMGLEQKNMPLQALGKVSQAAASRDGDLYLMSFRLTTVTNSRRESTQASSVGTASITTTENEPATEMSLVLDGLAMDDLTITSFIEDMNSTGLFYSVELTSIKEEKIDDRQLRIFNIECKL
ncbi:MAG: PilN domain-containing protein [Planctomycetaceae bacterium]|nr:PilN domain-containing protein [Planctomycetaceae bacterium]